MVVMQRVKLKWVLGKWIKYMWQIVRYGKNIKHKCNCINNSKCKLSKCTILVGVSQLDNIPTCAWEEEILTGKIPSKNCM